MPGTVSIGYATPNVQGTVKIQTDVQLTGTNQQGTVDYSFIKQNANSPQIVTSIVTTGNVQNITFNSVFPGCTGLLIQPPQPTVQNSNTTLTSLSFGWANNIAPINPLAYTDVCFDPINLPTTLSFNGVPANMAVQLIGY